MLPDSIKYQSKRYLGSSDPIKVYYDFSTGSVSPINYGFFWGAFLENLSESNSGLFQGEISSSLGFSSSEALDNTTGVGGFLENSVGDFSKGYIFIDGGENINLKDSSYLMMIDSDLSNDGVLFGGFYKETGYVQGQPVVSSKGFNFGLNSRGKLFFQSLDQNGDYCFTFNDHELSRKNVIGLNFSPSQIGVFRFDYLNDEIQSHYFPIQTSHIRNTDALVLGTSSQYWRTNATSLYSGKMEAFAIISGLVPATSLFEIGKGFFQEYFLNTGEVIETNILSGYVPQINYKTVITGQYAEITGYAAVRSGIDPFTQSVNITGSLQVKEGDRYYKDFGDYMEQVGFLSGVNNDAYSPTGQAEHATLGLQSGFVDVSGIELSTSQPYKTVNVPLYQIVQLTGQTNEIESITNEPVYITNQITGTDASGISYTGSVDGFKKDYIYFMGGRSGL